VVIAKQVLRFGRRSAVARAAFLGGIPIWLCFTVPAVAQAPGPNPGATNPAASAGAAAPATVAPATPPGGGDVAPKLAAILAQPGGLTAPEAARRAWETSVQASIEREDVRINRNTRSQIIWGYAPRLAFTGRVQRLSAVDGPAFTDPVTGMAQDFTPPVNQYFMNAGLTIPLTDYLLRLAHVLRGTNKSRDAEQYEENAARVTSAANGKLAYYDWVRARLEIIVAEQALSQASAQLARMQALHSVGRAPVADLLQAQAFEADAQLALSQSQTVSAIAEERLRMTIHTRPEEQLAIGEDVLADFAAKEEASGLDALYQEALAGRLEIKALQKNHAAIEDSRFVQKTQALPRLDAVGNLTHANPNQRVFPVQDEWNTTWDIGLQLTFAFNDLGTAAAQADTLDAQAVQVSQRRVNVEEQLKVEVVTAFGNLTQARQNIATAQQGERAAAAALEARMRLQEQGMGTALELMQAETARVEARLNLINAHIALRVARTQLDHAVGRDVPPDAR
jgi:outer membrane protein